MVGNSPLLPNPLGRVAKAPRDRHPSEPAPAPTPAPKDVEAPTPTHAVPTSRTGPNRVRKSLYIATDVAADLTTLTDAIHYDSRGSVSKADAAGELIRRGLDNATDAYRALGVTPSTP